MPKLLLICEQCGLKIEKRQVDFEKGDRHFCSHRCRAIYYNHKRRTLFPRPCKNLRCNNLVTAMDRSKKFCSQECATLVNNISHYTTKIVIRHIKFFYNNSGRIPFKHELSYLYEPARNLFGTWNKAIEAAGFSPNPVMFAKHYIANDGHKCDSLSEKIVDDWLFSRKITHLIHVLYPWNNGMKCDFKVENYWIEIFGLAGEHKRYDELKRTKLELIKQHKIKIIELSLNDVYKNHLDVKLACLRHHPS